MRVQVQFELHGETWLVHCRAEGGKRIIGPIVRVADADTLIYLLRYVGANDAEIDQIEEALLRANRGTIEIELKPRRKNLLHLQRPWSAGLVK